MQETNYSEVARNIDSMSEEEVVSIIRKYDLEQMNPFPGWKDYQLEALVETIDKLINKGKKNVLLDLPTGVGKSLINVLAMYAIKKELGDKWNGGFYTTPQVKLRNQLEEDQDLQHLYKALQSRADYTCGVTGNNCKDCEISNSDDQSCFNFEQCTYVANKRDAMGHDIAVLTFAYLIVDNYLPEYSQGEGDREEKISFRDTRSVVVTDEGHNLENQTASLHAGYKITPNQMPLDVYQNAFEGIPDNPTFGDIHEQLADLHRRVDEFVDRNIHVETSNVQNQVEECQKVSGKIGYCLKEIREGRDWVVNPYTLSVGGNKMNAVKLEPVKVDKFLQNFVWSRGDKRILSTATMMYRDNWPRWCERIGLNPKSTAVVSYGMPFDKENRPIVTGTIIDKFSSGGDKENWDKILQELNRIAGEHPGQKGLIHATSYNRAKDLFYDAKSREYPNLYDNVKLHSKKETGDIVENWENSDKNIIVSPSMMEGVDLYDDRCRWQVLLKVPYPNPYGDPRTKFIMDNMSDGWKWYRETTMMRIVQSVGRAVRNKNDYATYYVLDGSFEGLNNKVRTPDWFDEAIVESVETNELFGYSDSPDDLNSIFD